MNDSQLQLISIGISKLNARFNTIHRIVCDEDEKDPLCKIKSNFFSDELAHGKGFFHAKLVYKDVNGCHDWEIGERIGRDSQNSQVFSSQCAGDKFALKATPFKRHGVITPNIERTFDEVIYQDIAYQCHTPAITSKIHQIFVNNDGILFITDRLHTTVKDLFEKIIIDNVNGDDSDTQTTLIANLLKKCIEKIKILYENTNMKHRDCHLENFMVDNDGDVKLIDFGYATLKDYRDPDYYDEYDDSDLFTDIIASTLWQLVAGKTITNKYCQDILKKVGDKDLTKKMIETRHKYIKR